MAVLTGTAADVLNFWGNKISKVYIIEPNCT